jgi:hypothetical protein
VGHGFFANRTFISLKLLAIPAGFELATHGVEIRHSADHRLTTETPRTNGDKVRESSTNFIVFVEFFDCYLRSGHAIVSAPREWRTDTTPPHPAPALDPDWIFVSNNRA